MQSAWKEESALALGILLPAALAGMIGGRLSIGLLCGLGVYLGWHLSQLLRLPRLGEAGSARGPRPFGLWRHAGEAIRVRLAQAHVHAQELEAQGARYRGAIDALPDAVLMLNGHGRVEWSNAAAATLLGLVRPADAAAPLTRLIPDPLLREYLARGDYSQPLVLTAPVDPGRILSLSARPLAEGAGRLLLAAREITRQHHLDTAKREFVANISHELRTPLTVISGLAQQLGLHDSSCPELQRPARLMQEQVERMNEMIADLLVLSRLESRQAAARDEAVDVAALLGALAEEARALSGAAGHKILLEIESADRLRGDARELRTAFANLVTNAVRHTPPRSEVRVRWYSDDGGACCSVSDSGPGIAARHLPRLTERFYRVDPSRSRDTGGSGLGLAIVKHILDRHAATLEISSAVGGGSTFTCRFPARRVLGFR